MRDTAPLNSPHNQFAEPASNVDDGLVVEAIPAFSDNYLWLIHDGHAAVVVDPGDAVPVETTLERLRLELRAILVTHAHADHIGGIGALQAARDIPVYGPAHENIPHRTHPVGDGCRVLLQAPQLTLEVLDVPGHTRGHVAYYGQKRLFCGDTLFGCGCGRIDQPAATMHASLQRLAALPTDTQVYCTHEYTQANLRFALHLDPDNAALHRRAADVATLRAAGVPSVPSTIGEELCTNPFLRCDIDVMKRHAEVLLQRPSISAADVFGALRAMKDNYR